MKGHPWPGLATRSPVLPMLTALFSEERRETWSPGINLLTVQEKRAAPWPSKTYEISGLCSRGGGGGGGTAKRLCGAPREETPASAVRKRKARAKEEKTKARHREITPAFGEEEKDRTKSRDLAAWPSDVAPLGDGKKSTLARVPANSISSPPRERASRGVGRHLERSSGGAYCAYYRERAAPAVFHPFEPIGWATQEGIKDVRPA